MKTLFLLLSFVFSTSLFAQDSWTISHNGKTKLQASVEDETKNEVKIDSKNTLVKESAKGYFIVNYKELKKQKGWKRYIAFVDENDNEFYKQEGSVLKLSNTKLRKLMEPSKIRTVKIYTWSLPTDPELAARIRVRRVHLATIKFD